MGHYAWEVKAGPGTVGLFPRASAATMRSISPGQPVSHRKLRGVEPRPDQTVAYSQSGEIQQSAQCSPGQMQCHWNCVVGCAMAKLTYPWYPTSLLCPLFKIQFLRILSHFFSRKPSYPKCYGNFQKNSTLEKQYMYGSQAVAGFWHMDSS